MHECPSAGKVTVRWHFCVSGIFFPQAELWTVLSPSCCFSVDLELQSLLFQPVNLPSKVRSKGRGLNPACTPAQVLCPHSCPSWASEKTLALFWRDGEAPFPCTRANTPQKAGSNSNPGTAGEKAPSQKSFIPAAPSQTQAATLHQA